MVKAVDAPKTGNWAVIPWRLKRHLKKYPDFMMKQDKPSYPSEKILGQMFRLCTKYLNVCNIGLGISGYIGNFYLKFEYLNI